MRPDGLGLDVTTPPAGWSPWPAARAHWGRWGGLLEASLRTTSLNATRGGLCVAATFQLTAAEESTASLYRHARTTLGAETIPATCRVSPFVTWLPVRLCQSLHDRAGHEQGNDGDDLSDQNGAIQVESRPPLGLAVFDHPRAGRFGSHAKARAPVPLGIAAASAASHDVGRGNDRQPVLLVWLAVDPADIDDVLRLADGFQCVHRGPPLASSVRRYAPSFDYRTQSASSIPSRATTTSIPETLRLACSCASSAMRSSASSLRSGSW